jgi:Asp/Glu/hydantoin racemase
VSAPRIALIHALPESVAPIHEAFAAHWPQARTFDLLDSSLSRDLAHAGQLDGEMVERFITLSRYAASTEGEGGRAAAILFTCSAFRRAIDAVKADLRIPVLRPNEAAFEAALRQGCRIGLLVTFMPSLGSLRGELQDMARERGMEVQIEARMVEGALAALHAGAAEEHDRLIASSAERMTGCDALVLGQFSMARAAVSIRPSDGRAVITTPACAVSR